MKKTHRQNGVRWATASIALLAMNILLPSALLLATAADHPALVLSRHLSSPTIDRLNQALKSYQLLEADLPLLAEEARTQGRIHVVLEGIPHDLLLEVNNLYAPGIRWTMTTDSGVFDMPVPPPTTYRGSVDGETDSQLRLLIQGDLLLGFIRRGNDYLFIEPLSKYLPGARAGQLVAYHEDDVRPESAALCGTEGIHILAREVGGPPLSDKSDHFASVTFRRLQVASDADFEFFTIHNNTSAAFTNSYIAGILNQVDGIYHTDLNLGVSITFQNVYTTSSNPYTSSIANTLLNQFVTNWNNTRSGVTRDVAHLFSGKSLNSGIVGISYVGAACFTSAAYGLTSDYQPYTMKVSAHEIAHNLGAEHDDQSPAPILPCPGNGWLMCAYIQPSGPNDFSQKTKDAVSSYVASSATSTCLSILAGTPVVNTDAATNVQSTTATLNATVNPTGSSTSVYFQYGTTITNGSPVYGSTTSTQPIGSGSSNVAVVSPLTGLSANSTYHYQAVAINSAGTVYGNDATFATGAPATAPTVTTSPATGVQSTSATLNGTVNPNNASTTCYFQWGLTTAYGNTTSVQNAGSGSSIFNATQPISGLSSNTTYHYRLVATNSAGMTNGSDVAFTTALPITPPTVTTNAASSIQSGSATLNGTVNPNGSATTGYFNWGLTTAYGNSTSAQSMGSGSTGVALSAAVSGLSPNITYHFQAVGNNAGGTVLGSDVSFTTPLAITPPIVTTLAATSVIAGSATLNGSVNPNWGATTAYFHWGTTTSYGNSTGGQLLPGGSSTLPLSTVINGLQSDMTYHYQIVAVNGAGTSYGNDISFTTPMCAFTVSFSTQSFLAVGGSGTATVTASASDCSWTAGSNVSWMTIDSGSAGTGNGVVRYSVAGNPSPVLRTGQLTAAGKSILVAQSGSTSIGFDAALPAGSVISRYSQGQGPLSVTYGVITASTTSPPVALANFGWAANGVLVTEVGIPASSTMTSTRLFVDYSNTHNSGIGIVNPNNVSLNMLLTLRNQSGIIVSTASLSLGPAGHTAKFVNELGLILPNPFLGTLTISGDVPFAAVNLRTSVNGHGETLFSALPLVDLNNIPISSSLIFPQVLDGGGSPTQILLMNPSDIFSAAGRVAIFDDNGNPLALDFGPGLGVLSTLDYSMSPSGMLKFSTTGLGPLRVGYIIVTPTFGALPVGGAIFSMSGTAGVASQAGVLNTLPGIDERLFIDVAATPLARNTGIAVVNNNVTTANLNLNLAGIDGSTHSGTLTIVPNGHVAKFITELFSGLPANFQGIMTITSNVPIAPLLLRLTTNQRGETIASTLPAAGPGSSTSYPLIIPQIVDGGGYQTQLIILNLATGPGQIHIDFLNDSGVYVILPLN
jgi:hypothetical protein